MAEAIRTDLTAHAGESVARVQSGGVARRAQLDVPSAVVAALMGAFTSLLLLMLWRHVEGYGTFSFDMGIYEQTTWLLANGENPFITVRGLNVWGHHVNLILFAFAPAYWVGIGGPLLLSWVQALSLILGAIPLFLLARARTNRWTAVVVVLAYLLYPALGWMARVDFHPEVLSVGPTLWAGWLAYRRRWGWFALAVVIVLSTREEAGIVIGMLGLTMAWRDSGWIMRSWRTPWRFTRPATSERISSVLPGLVTAAAGIGWFLVCTRLIIPRYVDGEPYYVAQFFGQWGDGMAGALLGIVSRPDKVVRVVTRAPRPEYYQGLFAPVLLLPLFGLSSLAAAPQLGINALTDVPYAHNIHYQYNAFVVAPLFLGLVDALARIERSVRWRGRVRLGLLATTIICSLTMSAMPWSVGAQGWWSSPDEISRLMDQAVAIVPDEGGVVSATHRFVPKLTHRTEIYEFPNPFIAQYWGVTGEDPLPDTVVDWLVLEVDLLSDEMRSYARTLYEIDDAPYEIVFEDSDIIVARRRT